MFFKNVVLFGEEEYFFVTVLGEGGEIVWFSFSLFGFFVFFCLVWFGWLVLPYGKVKEKINITYYQGFLGILR